MPPHILARLVAPLALAVWVALAADPPVDRELSHYLVLGLQATRLKSLTIEAPGCSVGVNCPATHVQGAAAA